MGYFGESSQRIKDFREDLLNTPAYICAERGVLYTEAHKQHKAEPIITLTTSRNLSRLSPVTELRSVTEWSMKSVLTWPSTLGLARNIR